MDKHEGKMYENEEIRSNTPTTPEYENDSQQIRVFEFETRSSSNGSNSLILPRFQRKLPIVPVAIFGIVDIVLGLGVLILEILVFHIGVGIWCGLVYVLSGVATMFFIIGTDRERYQASTTFIFQLVALSFSISEIYLHYTEFLGETCAEIKLKKMFISCQTLIIQICFASVVCASSTCFTIIYIYVSLIDLKKTYGTFNISNVLNFNC